MQTDAQRSSGELDAVLSVALEAAVERASKRAKEVILTARLATTVHMRRLAEPAPACPRRISVNESVSLEAAPVCPTAAAQLTRRGGGL